MHARRKRHVEMALGFAALAATTLGSLSLAWSAARLRKDAGALSTSEERRRKFLASEVARLASAVVSARARRLFLTWVSTPASSVTLVPHIVSTPDAWLMHVIDVLQDQVLPRIDGCLRRYPAESFSYGDLILTVAPGGQAQVRAIPNGHVATVEAQACLEQGASDLLFPRPESGPRSMVLTVQRTDPAAPDL